MNRPQIPIAGLLGAIAILAVIFTMIGRPDRTVLTLWNLAVWGLPTIAILWVYGPAGFRDVLRAVAARLFRMALILAIVAGFVMLLGGLGLMMASLVEPRPDRVLLVPFTLWALGLSVLTLAIVTRRGLRVRETGRPFAVGFAVTGWTILLAGLAPVWNESVPDLWTTEVFHDPLLSRVVWRGYLQYHMIAHCLVTLAVAMAGGLLARQLAARREASAVTPADEPSPEDFPLSGGTSRSLWPAPRADEPSPEPLLSSESTSSGTLLGTMGRSLSERNP